MGSFSQVPDQLKFLIVGVYYFAKWKLFLKSQLKEFASAMVTNFCRDLRVLTKFVSIFYLHANGQADSANNVILKGLKKKLNDVKGLWEKLLHEILWTYTPPFNLLPRKLYLPWCIEQMTCWP